MVNIKIGNPYLIQIHIIDSCIINCQYCYLGKKINKFIPYDNFKIFFDKIISQTKKYGIKLHVTLTGGDLWLYEKFDDLQKIFYYCKENKNISGIFLMLNNLWYKKSKYYLSLILNKLIGIQLNTDIISDRMQDIKYLLHINCKIYFKVMLSKNNNVKKQLNIIKEIFQKFKNNDNLYISIDRVCPASPNNLKYSLTKGELFYYLNIIRNNYGNKFITEDPFIKAYLLNNTYEPGSIYGCTIPFGGLSIFPDGNIKLCSRLPYIYTGYNVSNFNLLRYIKSFFINRNNNIECKYCSLFNICQGGCPAIRYINNKTDFLKKDFQCFLNL